MNRRALHILGILAIMLAVFGGLLSAGTTMAAPPAQIEVEEEVGATGSGFSQVSTDVQRGVLSLAAQAANAGRWALVLVESDPGVGFAGGQFGLEDEQGLGQEVNILTPSTQLGLRTTFEVLNVIRDSLEDYQLIAQQDIGEEISFQGEILEGLEIEEGQGLIEEQEEAGEALTDQEGATIGEQGVTQGQEEDIDVTELGSEEDLLGNQLDISVNVVETQCGDLDTQVGVMQADIARALGFRAFGVADEVDPDARLLALDALRSHYLELRQTLSCLSGLVGEGIGGVGEGVGGLGEGLGGVGEGIGEGLGEGLGVGEGLTENEGVLGEGLGEGLGDQDIGEGLGEDLGDEFIVGGDE